MNKDIFNQFCSVLGSDNVSVEEPMKKHTTFRIGGPADYYLCPHSMEEIQEVVKVCNKEQIPHFIIGNGSNLLVSDKGYRGAIIQIYKNMSDILVEGTKMTVKAGMLLSQVARTALDYGLGGFEFAAGIPGTIGGAVVMNAGAYGGEMKDVIEEVVVMNQEGEIIRIEAKDLEFGYRTSVVKKSNYIVLEAIVRLYAAQRSEIKQRMDELKVQRTTKQPLEFPSAGSTFKRPEGHFAGKLIMDANLRGYSVGGAQISEKHCGFVINKGDAKAQDVIDLIHHVQKNVYEQFQVHIEPEVQFLGEFEEN